MPIPATLKNRSCNIDLWAYTVSIRITMCQSTGNLQNNKELIVCVG